MGWGRGGEGRRERGGGRGGKVLREREGRWRVLWSVAALGRGQRPEL